MSETKYIGKVIYDSKVLIDLTGDTIVPENLDQGITAHDKSGKPIVGTSTKDSDTSDATVTVAEMLEGKTSYARGVKLTGSMPNNGGASEFISTKSQKITVPLGFHDGSGKISIADAEQEKIIGSNIKQGITILGVEGEYAGESANLQSKTVTPSSTMQTVQADDGYDALSSVVVNAISYTETNNSAGGITVTIGA